MDATLRGPANKRIIGNNFGHHLFQYLNKLQTNLDRLDKHNAAKFDRLDKDSKDIAAKFERQERTLQALQAGNRRLRSAMQSSQAVRSRLFENFRKASSLGSHDHKAIECGDHVAHRGSLDEDWQLYEDRVRSDFEVFLKVYGISHGEARMYIGDQFLTPIISTNIRAKRSYRVSESLSLIQYTRDLTVRDPDVARPLPPPLQLPLTSV